MDLEEFIKMYDYPGSIVLLEGKRTVLEKDKSYLTDLAYQLAKNSKHIVFRSGNAGGSDELFAEGVAKVDAKRMEVVIPYTGHRKKANQNYATYALDELDVTAEPDLINYSLQNKGLKQQVQRYIEGKRDRFAIKAAYILRDTMKVLGNKEIPKATAALFYDDLIQPMTGGTGHTMLVCKEEGVPMFDQREWLEWIKS
jgi:hypothetical protein